MNKPRIRQHIDGLKETQAVLRKNIRVLEKWRRTEDYGSAMLNDLQILMPLTRAKAALKANIEQIEIWEAVIDD